MLNRFILILCAVEGLAALAFGVALIFSGSDPAAADLDRLAGIALVIVAAIFVLPPWRLVSRGKIALAPGFALAPVLIIAAAILALT